MAVAVAFGLQAASQHENLPSNALPLRCQRDVAQTHAHTHTHTHRHNLMHT